LPLAVLALPLTVMVVVTGATCGLLPLVLVLLLELEELAGAL
jgi:hypothetical protein